MASHKMASHCATDVEHSDSLTDSTASTTSGTQRLSGAASETDSLSERSTPLVVLKVGTSTLMASDEMGFRVDLGNVARLVELIGSLKRDGYQVVLVSSGAVGMGCIKLGLTSRPKCIRTKQAVAAAGQSHLMRTYEDLFGTLNMQVAQLLINQSDFLDKDHWQSVKGTINECLKLDVVPIINENDSTSTEELRFGDNDNLAALTAVQLEADAVFLFTDVDYLYTANPRADPNAKPLRMVQKPWALEVDTSEEGSGLGTGGMTTKILAARTASTAGIPCGLINGQNPERIYSFLEFGLRPSAEKAEEALSADPGNLPQGTYFMAMPQEESVGDTRRWILALPSRSEVHVDDASARELARRRGLLPVGVLKVEGTFPRCECVKLFHRGSEIGRSIMNFSSEELKKIQGKPTDKYESLLGFITSPEACHSSNIVLTVDPQFLKKAGQPEQALEQKMMSSMFPLAHGRRTTVA